jgi:hypothetical protein
MLSRFIFIELLTYLCSSSNVVWLIVGERFCQAIDINRNGMVMTTVVIKMGGKEVGSILMPNI